MQLSYATTAKAPRYIGIGAAAYAILGGVLSFMGWLIDNDRLTDWWATGIHIKANTAVAITAVGLALFIAVFARATHPLARILAAFVASLGTLTLFEHITSYDLGIDTLLFDEPPGAPATAAPGRMGPPAAVSFMALGMALLLGQRLRARAWTIILPLIVCGIATLSLIGFMYGAQAMYTIPRLTGISLQSATMLLALAVSMIALQADREPMRTLSEDGTAGILARRIIAAAVVVPLGIGWLRIQGQQLALYDSAFGTALRTLIEIAILTSLSWWVVYAMRLRDQEERRAQAERRAGEQRLRKVLDASAVPFTVLAPSRDESGEIVDFRWEYLNGAAARALRKDSTELSGRGIFDTLPALWDEPGLFERCVRVLVYQEIQDFELHLTTDEIDGWFQVVASPLEDNVAIWFADVSERKRQEIELRDADRRKDEFLAILAHELRNPLAPIRQVATLFAKPTLSESQRQWCMDVVERQVRHMSVLLEDLLDVSRITRGILELRKQPAELRAVVESAIETARPLIDSKRHTLTVDLPPGSTPLHVDPVRVSQVVANLLNNAAKYTDAGGFIRLTGALRQRDLILTVSDNGLGLRKEELETIFRMFSQARVARERADGGLGIGLALSRGLIELHGGTLTAESAGLNAGSSFTIEIPNAAATVAEHQELGAASTALPSLRILLADDNVDAGDSLAMLLRSDGHQVTLVRDGEEAVRAFAECDPDAVLLDLGMPRLSGYEVAKRLRAENSIVLLVAITGWGQSGDRARSAAAGFDHHLTKPVDYRELTKLLALDAVRLQSSSGSHLSRLSSNGERSQA